MSIFKSRVAAVSVGALLLAGAATTGAVADGLIGSKDIKNDSVRSIDVKNETLRLADLRPGAVAALQGQDGRDGEDGAQGPKGDTGAQGPAGPAGPKGDPGLSNVRADEPYGGVAKANSVSVVFATCPTGKAAIGGGFRLNAPESEAFQGGGYAVPGVTAIASEPVGVLDGKVVVNTYQNSAFPQDEDGRFLPNAWAVTVQNTTDKDQQVRAAVVCATVN